MQFLEFVHLPSDSGQDRDHEHRSDDGDGSGCFLFHLQNLLLSSVVYRSMVQPFPHLSRPTGSTDSAQDAAHHQEPDQGEDQ